MNQSIEAGSLLLQVSVTDTECLPDYCVTYSLEPAASGFEIDPLNGLLFVIILFYIQVIHQIACFLSSFGPQRNSVKQCKTA